MPLDLLVTGRIATFAGNDGFGWVDAIGVRAGRVAFAGSAVELETRADPHTVRIDLDPDEMAIPALTDSHLHLADAALSVRALDLGGAEDLPQALAAITAYAGRCDATEWVTGHGWDVDRLGGWPTAAHLDAAAPGRHIALWAHDHHALWVSSAVLGAAGVVPGIPDPEGGHIRRLADGRPSGVLHEAATGLVLDVIPQASADAIAAALPDLVARLHALGVVAVHDPGMMAPDPALGRAWAAYRDLDDAEELQLRIHASLRQDGLAEAGARGLRSGDALGSAPTSLVRVGWLKLFADGTLGSRTAALLDPVEDEADRPVPAGQERGIWLTPPGELRRLVALAAEQGIATQIHAIGDAAVRASLDALAPHADRSRVMPRIEHLQLVHPDDRPRFAAAGIAASVQPVHLRSDAETARRTWGDRAETHGYAWRSLAEAGALIAFGTDAPVEPIDPWPGIAMAVLRRDPSWGRAATPYGPDEMLSLATALRAACVAPAMTAGEFDRGRLVPGQRADFIVLPSAPREVAEDAPAGFASVRPRMTVLDGEIVFET